MGALMVSAAAPWWKMPSSPTTGADVVPVARVPDKVLPAPPLRITAPAPLPTRRPPPPRTLLPVSVSVGDPVLKRSVLTVVPLQAPEVVTSTLLAALEKLSAT